MTFGSLFSGIGGMDLGLERAGMVCKWQVEIDPFCRRVLTKHWPEVPKYEDVRTVGRELERVDLIAGGFPCQDLSVAGKRRGIQEGTRSGLWAEFHRIIGDLRPRFVLIENVSGLLANEPMRRVLGDLSALGYDAEWESIPAAAVGAPHIRDRVWVFANARQVSIGSQDGGGWGCVGGEAQRQELFPKASYREASEWSKDWELIALVPGVHQRVAADWWRSQSRMARSADGIPDQVDRNAALGNAVVPQVAEWIGRRIMEAQ